MKIFFAIAALFLATQASAQTISPVISQGNKGHGRGEFVVTNNGLTPMIVTIEPRKLVPQDGKVGFVPLDDELGIQYKLSQLSAKLGPKQTHTFQYEIACNQDCAIAFYAAFNDAKRKPSEMNIVLHLPTSVWLCADKQSADTCRMRMKKSWGIKD